MSKKNKLFGVIDVFDFVLLDIFILAVGLYFISYDVKNGFLVLVNNIAETVISVTIGAIIFKLVIERALKR